MKRTAKEKTRKGLKGQKPGARKSAAPSPESGAKIAKWGEAGKGFREFLAHPPDALPGWVRPEPNTAGEHCEAEGIREMFVSLFARGSGAGEEAEIARHEIADIVKFANGAVESMACQSPGKPCGQWAGRFLAEHTKRLLSASPGAVKVTWDETRNNSTGLLSGNLAFVDRLRALLCRGPGKKAAAMRGADISRFVFQTWREGFSLWESGHFAKSIFPQTRVPISSEQQRAVEVLDRAEQMMRRRKPDGAGVARMVFSDLLASMLESRWDAACEEFPAMARVARHTANNRGMMSSFSAKRDNLRDAWMSIAAGEHGLPRLLA